MEQLRSASFEDGHVDGETTFYDYDLYGNLLSVALSDGRTIEYDVDGAGRRVGRRVLDSQGNELEYRGWIYRDLLRPIAEVDATGNVVARYIYADGAGSRQNGVGQLSTRLGVNQDMSLPFAGSNVPEFIEELDATGGVERTLTLVTNQVGTVELVTDAATDEVVQRLEYDDFGRVLSNSNPVVQPFGFAGGLLDADTGLARFGARDYEPSTERWLLRDPLGFDAYGSNLFAYVLQEPIQLTDARELDVNWTCATVAARFVAHCTACVGFGAAAILDPELISKAAAAGAAASQCINCDLQFKAMDDICNPDPDPEPGPSEPAFEAGRSVIH